LLCLQVLGLPQGADSTAVQRAYRKRMSEVKGKDDAAAQRIEAAHSTLMMQALTSRLKVRSCSALAPSLAASDRVLY
jgi:hypothetical protein